MKVVKRSTQEQLMGLKKTNFNSIDDSFFDGEVVPVHLSARNWHPENELHSSSILTKSIGDTRNFLGQNTSILRDDLRRKTFAAIIENTGKLKILKFEENSSVESSTEVEKDVFRSEIALDKYSGKLFVAAVIKDGGTNKLYFNGSILKTEATNPDFPLLSISQVPIGHIPNDNFSYGIMTYKCRDSKKIFFRQFKGTTVGEERVLFSDENSIGGAGIATSGDSVLFRVDVRKNGKIIAMLAKSSNQGNVVEGFSPVDLPYGDEFELLPASSSPIQDYIGTFHVPLAIASDKETIALDYVDGYAIVEAIKINGGKDVFAKAAFAAFPKKPKTKSANPEFGDGVTDGVGVIATIKVNGQLYSSNSQSGGASYPMHNHLNHEMPSISALALTECYTDTVSPNIVSMDYLYMESSIDGGPLSPELHFETWDMALPKPIVRATSSRNTVHLEIEKDANFFQGKTIVKIEDPILEVLSFDIKDSRNATLVVSSSDIKGKYLSIDVLSQFYHHNLKVEVK